MQPNPPFDDQPSDSQAAVDVINAVEPIATTRSATVNLVVIFLGLLALVTVLGSVLLSYLEKPDLPGEIIIIGATAAGAIGALLGSTRSTGKG